MILQEKINSRNIQKYIHCHLEADLKIRHWKRHPVAHEVQRSGRQMKVTTKCHPKAQAKALDLQISHFFAFWMLSIVTHSWLRLLQRTFPCEMEKNLLLPLYRCGLSRGGCYAYFLLNSMPKGSCENQPHSRPWFHGHMPAVSWCVRRHTPVPLWDVFPSAGIWLTFSTSLLQEQFISYIKQITLSESLS